MKDFNEFWNGDTQTNVDEHKHNLRFVTITVLQKEFSGDDLFRIQEFIENIKGDYPTYDTKEGYSEICFEAHNLLPNSIEALSKRVPEAIVIESCHWDDAYFNILRNGESYNNYTLSLSYWVSDDDKEEMYEINAKIHLTINEKEITVDGGGGDRCTKEELEWYQNKEKKSPAEEVKNNNYVISYSS